MRVQIGAYTFTFELGPGKRVRYLLPGLVRGPPPPRPPAITHCLCSCNVERLRGNLCSPADPLFALPVTLQRDKELLKNSLCPTRQDVLNYGDADDAANIDVHPTDDGSFLAAATRPIREGQEARVASPDLAVPIGPQEAVSGTTECCALSRYRQSPIVQLAGAASPAFCDSARNGRKLH